jgi:hypothetical protein
MLSADFRHEGRQGPKGVVLLRRYALWIGGLCLVVAGLLASCSTTSMINRWTDPAYTGGKMKHVLVLGVSGNPAMRRSFEDSYVSRLGAYKVQAEPSYRQFPDAGQITKEEVEAYVRAQGIDHVLVARIVDRQTVQEYVPPTVSTMYAPSYPGYYGGWYPYYSMSYSTVVSPGYTYERVIVTVETNVYDVPSTKMIWNGMTDTEMGDTVANHIADYIDVVISYLKRDKLI